MPNFDFKRCAVDSKKLWSGAGFKNQKMQKKQESQHTLKKNKNIAT